MCSPYLLDDVVINLIALKSEESILPPDQVVSILSKAIDDLNSYKRYKSVLIRHINKGRCFCD